MKSQAAPFAQDFTLLDFFEDGNTLWRVVMSFPQCCNFLVLFPGVVPKMGQNLVTYKVFKKKMLFGYYDNL